jgi:hypothetical protein
MEQQYDQIRAHSKGCGREAVLAREKVTNTAGVGLGVSCRPHLRVGFSVVHAETRYQRTEEKIGRILVQCLR